MVAPAVTPEQPAAQPPSCVASRSPRWHWWARAALAAGGGGVLYLSFPPRPLWWLAPVAFALLSSAVHGRRARTGFTCGLLFGLGFMVPLLHWTGIYVGPVPWLALSLIESLFVGGAGAAIAVVSRTRGAALWTALLWVAGEFFRSTVPFGGFPWGRVAFGQPDGVYLPLAAVGGTPLIGFAVTLTGFGLADLARRLHTATLGAPNQVGRRTGRKLVAPALAVVLPVVAGLAVTPMVGVDGQNGSATVALVQGNVPRLGLDFNSQRRAVLDNHVRRTLRLAEDVRAGRVRQPDLVIWPENSSDIDPYRNADANAEISQAAQAMKAPIAVGAVVSPLGSPGPKNTAILWDPRRGPVDEYVKRRLQPFGETMPLRALLRNFSSYVDRAGNFQPGTDPRVFTMGPARVGIATCYEVAFDGTVRDSVLGGAQLLAVPTNNATFGRSEMTYQQLAMSRVRAVEHGRAVVIAATSGVSAVVQPDGNVTQRTDLFTPAALVAQVPLRSATTLATRLGAIPEWTMATAGLVALTISVGAGVRRRRRASVSAAPGEPRPADLPTD